MAMPAMPLCHGYVSNICHIVGTSWAHRGHIVARPGSAHMRPKRQISATKAWRCTAAAMETERVPRVPQVKRYTRYTRYTLLETGLDRSGWTEKPVLNFHKFDLFQIFQIRQMFHVMFDLSIFSMFAAFNVVT